MLMKMGNFFLSETYTYTLAAASGGGGLCAHSLYIAQQVSDHTASQNVYPVYPLPIATYTAPDSGGQYSAAMPINPPLL
jgi:hypothetical protein